MECAGINIDNWKKTFFASDEIAEVLVMGYEDGHTSTGRLAEVVGDYIKTDKEYRDACAPIDFLMCEFVNATIMALMVQSFIGYMEQQLGNKQAE